MIELLPAVMSAIILGIFWWTKRHRHDWHCVVVYDSNGDPAIMLKFCECTKITFDGRFEKPKD